MTGMDVLRQCRRYGDDVAKLKLKKQIALDTATRITGSMSGGGGRSSDVSDKAGTYARKAKEVELALEAREEMYTLEMFYAGEALASLGVDAASVMYARMIQGKTVRQAAGALHKSESAVRGLYARARAELDAAPSPIGESAAYRKAMERYRENDGTLAERFVKCLSAGEPL